MNQDQQLTFLASVYFAARWAKQKFTSDVPQGNITALLCVAAPTYRYVQESSEARASVQTDFNEATTFVSIFYGPQSYRNGTDMG